MEIKIGNTFFRDTDLYGKTFFAAKELKAKRNAVDNAPVKFTIPKGKVIGTFLGFAPVNEAIGRKKPYIIFGKQPSDIAQGKSFVIEYAQDAFSDTDLRGQSTPTSKEVAEEEARREKEEMESWYSKLIGEIMPWLIFALVLYLVAQYFIAKI